MSIDYPAHLAKMWQRALALRDANAPTLISLFAGGGGSLAGYLMAGYRELLAVEWDSDAALTLRRNHPSITIYHGDIAQLSAEKCMALAGVAPGELDLLDGSPPCQGFSTSGKRQRDDPRNQLFRDFVRLLRVIRPKTFVMENVSGMVKGEMKLSFAVILRELKASGYQVSCRLLNAKYFHVPQSRERLIFIGVRDDLGIRPSHPSAESRPITVRRAIADLESDQPDRPMKDWLKRACKQIQQGANSRTVGKIFKQHKGTTGSSMSTKRLVYDRPSNTIGKQEVAASGLLHPTKDRYLTQRELMRLGSFPDDYLFTNRQRAVERIGNSVPPLLAEAIGRHVRTAILNKIETGGFHER